MPDQRPQQQTGKIAIVIGAIVLAIVVITFFGMNLSHHQAAQREEQGQRSQDANMTDAKPQGPHDLGPEPQPQPQSQPQK